MFIKTGLAVASRCKFENFRVERESTLYFLSFLMRIRFKERGQRCKKSICWKDGILIIGLNNRDVHLQKENTLENK